MDHELNLWPLHFWSSAKGSTIQFDVNVGPYITYVPQHQNKASFAVTDHRDKKPKTQDEKHTSISENSLQV